MLKFDELGWGPAIKEDRAYAALLNEVTECKAAKLHLKDGDSTVDPAVLPTEVLGTCRVRHAGNGHVVEGHFAYTVGDDGLGIEVDKCTLELTGEITRVIPEKAQVLDLSDLFKDLTTDDVTVTITPAQTPDSAAKAKGKIVLPAAAPAGGTTVTVQFKLAGGKATTDNNAANVQVGPGNYQIHLVARAHNDINTTRMPNPTMMEFVRHCRKIDVDTPVGA